MIVRELKPSLWPDLERLFAKNGACGGCWCMYWRQKKGEKWEGLKGEANRRRLKTLVEAGKAHGAIAYENGEPVGWVSFDRRVDYDKLDRAPSFRCEEAEEVWSIPCFFVPARRRGKGIATSLLVAALRFLKRRRVKAVEGYPVRPGKKGARIPAAFAWTGTRSLFARAGFRIVGNRGGGKERVRRAL